MKKLLLILSVVWLAIAGCTKDPANGDQPQKEFSVFFVNDVHGQLQNFAKIKQIVESEQQKTNVIVACSGNIFSGNPAVDNYQDKGFPMIDVMNRVGFDVMAIGNHDFDYGPEVLKKRI
ncbi:MAG: metallophosphoesterase [Prolixibacteraceae bacterium]|nr:metallophosphoesterase [Prolixibacteraceae bacterium]